MIGVCGSAERDRLALAHGVNRVEVHRERGVQRVVGLVGVLDARDADVGGVVARVEHDAAERLFADCGDQRRRELSQLFGDQKRIAAPANVEHPFAVQVEAGLEAIVAAQDLHRQPRGHDLGDGGRDEGLVSVLNHQLVALFVHREHQPRRSERRDLLLGAGQGLGGQHEQGAGEDE